jgi:hypothetical protein
MSKPRRFCVRCARPAVFRSRTGYVSDEQHDFCQKCWRSVESRVRAEQGQRKWRRIAA